MAKLPDATHARSLCRVDWQLGQALLPAHFEHQEDGLLREMALRTRLLAPPAWGVAQIGFDSDQLARGTVRLTRLVAVMPRGRLVDLPGNACSEPLMLASAGNREVELYAHLLAESKPEKADPAAPDREAVVLAVQRVELTPAPSHPDAVDSLPLARLEQAPDGVWAIRGDCVPPLIALAAWPEFFERVVDRIRTLLASWEAILLDDLKSDVLSVATRLRAHECLRRGRLHGWFLTQIDATAWEHDSAVAAHPFELFRRLIDLYLDVDAHEAAPDKEPDLARQVYDHRNIAGCFEPLLAALERGTRRPHGRVPYAQFLRDGRIAACPLPAASDGKRWYWLVRSPPGADPVAVGAVKLAACDRLEVVHRHALRGVTLKPLTSPPFRHDFDPDVAFYEIVADGEEWDFARRTGKLGYVAEGPIAACETYLFWPEG